MLLHPDTLWLNTDDEVRERYRKYMWYINKPKVKIILSGNILLFLIIYLILLLFIHLFINIY